jgi:hypothetical protein
MVKQATKSPAKSVAKLKKAVGTAVPPAPAAPAKAPPAPAKPAPEKPATTKSLPELAAAIIADAHVPSPDEIKALAAAVLKHNKPGKDKKAKKNKEKEGKKAKLKADKKGKSSTKKSDAKKPKVRLPKLRNA